MNNNVKEQDKHNSVLFVITTKAAYHTYWQQPFPSQYKLASVLRKIMPLFTRKQHSRPSKCSFWNESSASGKTVTQKHTQTAIYSNTVVAERWNTEELLPKAALTAYTWFRLRVHLCTIRQTLPIKRSLVPISYWTHSQVLCSLHTLTREQLAVSREASSWQTSTGFTPVYLAWYRLIIPEAFPTFISILYSLRESPNVST